MVKEKLKSILNKIKNNKKKVIGVTIGVFAVFIFTFAVYNLNNPTYFNRLFASIGSVPNENFNDTNFYSCVVDAYNSANGTSKAYTDNLTDDELSSIKKINCYSKNIEDTKGIEKLNGLTELSLDNNLFTNIDLTNNTLLEELSISNDNVDNQLASIDLSNNTSLTTLDLSDNQLTSIDLSNNTSLTTLDLIFNQLTSLDISKNIALTDLSLGENQLTSLDLSNNTSLTTLNLHYNQLTNIDVSVNTSLTNLNLSDNQLTSIDLSNNASLTNLDLSYNQLTSIDLSNNTALTSLTLYNNQLTSIDLSNNASLTNLVLSDNQLTSIDLSNNASLTNLVLSDNQLTSIDLSNNINLSYLSIDGTSLIEDILIQNGETYTIEEKIIPPSGQNFSYSVNDTSVASVSGNIITALKEGSTRLVTRFGKASFVRKLAVGSVKLSTSRSDYVKIDNDKKYVYFDFFDRQRYEDYGELNEYVNVNVGKLKINDNMLQVVSGSRVLDEYKIVYVDSSEIIDNDYLFVITSVNDLEPIRCVNCTYELSGDGKEISIKYDNNIIDKKKIIYIFLPENNLYLSEGIFIFNNKIYDEKNIKEINNISEIEKDKINFLNASPKIKKEGYNNSIELYYNGNIIDNYLSLFNFYSNSYDLTKNYIYLGLNDFINDIEVKSTEVDLTFEDLKEYFVIKDDSLSITDDCVPYRKKWDLIKVSSDKYDMSGDTINLGNEDIDLSKINVTNATLKKEDNKLLIMYGDEVVKEFKLEGGRKTTTTTKKNDEKTTTTKDKTTTKKETKTTTTKKKVSIIDKIFGNKETTTVKKEETTTKKNIFRKSTTTKVENSSGNVTSNNKNSFKKLVTGSNLLILFLSITGIALIIYIIIDKKKNKEA